MNVVLRQVHYTEEPGTLDQGGEGHEELKSNLTIELNNTHSVIVTS